MLRTFHFWTALLDWIFLLEVRAMADLFFGSSQFMTWLKIPECNRYCQFTPPLLFNMQEIFNLSYKSQIEGVFCAPSILPLWRGAVLLSVDLHNEGYEPWLNTSFAQYNTGGYTVRSLLYSTRNTFAGATKKQKYKSYASISYFSNRNIKKNWNKLLIT